VEGNHTYTREQIFAVAGLKIGQMAGKAEFEAARDRLVASGAFETVGYKFSPGANGQGYAAVFQVVEVETAYPVRFEELGVPQGDLERMLRERDPLFAPAHLPATEAVLQRYTRWIQEYVDAHGSKEKIAGRVTAVGPDQFAIVFRPARNLPAVAQVTFEGNQVVSQTALREAVRGAAIGSQYTEDRFREVLNSSVKPVYEARGRLRVSFPKLRTEPAKDVAGVHVFVTIDEGQSFELGDVSIAGETPIAPEALLKTGDFKKGDIADMERVNQGLERIRQAVRRAGYLEAKVTSDRRIDDAKKKVDVSVRIEPGPQFTMGKLTIVGLDLDAEAEINRMWNIKEGKAFNPEYPNFFLSRIREQGIFDNLGETKAEVQVNEKDHTADVTLRFAGTDPSAQPGKRRRQ
jgi:outer membrane protein assembly factor BamA